MKMITLRLDGMYHRPRGTWCLCTEHIFYFDPRLYSISSIRGLFFDFIFISSLRLHLYTMCCGRFNPVAVSSHIGFLFFRLYSVITLGLHSIVQNVRWWLMFTITSHNNKQNRRFTHKHTKNSVIDSHNLWLRNVKVHNTKPHQTVRCIQTEYDFQYHQVTMALFDGEKNRWFLQKIQTTIFVHWIH